MEDLPLMSAQEKLLEACLWLEDIIAPAPLREMKRADALETAQGYMNHALLILQAEAYDIKEVRTPQGVTFDEQLVSPFFQEVEHALTRLVKDLLFATVTIPTITPAIIHSIRTFLPTTFPLKYSEEKAKAAARDREASLEFSS